MDWADQAYAQFRAVLPAEVRDALSSRRSDCNVALYGPTQVGKTTLLLTLLGVREERIEEIGTVLRGKRPQGQSATATAMTYQVSSGDYWTWRELPTERGSEPHELDSKGLIRKLAKLRASVEDRQWGVDKTVEVGLPVSCFKPDASFSVKVLDLPGISGRDPGERLHAETLIQDRIAVTDMVLLVGLVDQLGFLHPDVLGSDALRSWVHMPDRFAVVLTHTYSDGTVRGWLADRAVASRDQLQAELAREITTHCVALPEHAGALWLYPLEFGGSWLHPSDNQGVQRPAGNSLDVSREFRDAFLRDLADAMERGSAPEARIRHAFRVGALAKAKREERKRELDSRIGEARRALDHARAGVKECEKRIRAHRADLPDFEDLRARINRLRGAAFPLDAIGANWAFTGQVTEPVDGVAASLSRNFKKAVATWMEQEAKTRLAMPLTVRNAVGSSDREATALVLKADAAVTARFAEIRAFIDRKFTWFKAPLWRRGRDEVTGMVRAAQSTLATELLQYLAEHADNRARIFHSHLEEHWRRLEQTGRALDATKSQAVRAAKHEEQNVSQAVKKRDTTIAELDAAETTGRTFPRRLKTKHEETRLGLLQELARTDDQVERLAIAVAVLDHARIYDSIQSGG